MTRKRREIKSLHRGLKVKRTENEVGKRQRGEGEERTAGKGQGKNKMTDERCDQRKGRREGID